MHTAKSQSPLVSLMRLVVAAALLMALGVGQADVPGGRLPPSGAAPNPGTQQQELANSVRAQLNRLR